MIYYKNNRFFIGGISYALPQDICIVLAETEYTNVNGFVYTSPDKRITVIINTEGVDEAPEEFFKSDYFKDDLYITGDIEYGSFGEVMGVFAFCECEKCEYYEMRLQLPRPTEEEKILTITVEVQKEVISIRDALEDKSVSELLISIKKDLTAPVFL